MGKIPEKAKKVFSGNIYDIYQWEQELYDGSTMTYEMAGRKDSVMVLCTQGDKILIANEEQPTKPLSYGFFGGKAEEGETPQQAAQRELKEETGFETDDWDLYKTYQIGGLFLDWNVHLFIARNVEKVAEPQLEQGERINVVEFNFDDFITTVFDTGFRNREVSLDVFRMHLNDPELKAFKERILGK